MSLNFQNILTESIVDDLKISKLDKVALKVFNIIKDDKFYYPNKTKALDMTDGQRIVKASEMLKIGDYNYLYSIYDFYMTYCSVISGDINEAIMEEMYSVEIRNYTLDTSIFVNMFPSKREPNKLGCDYLSMSDELSEFIPIYRETDEEDYEEIVATKYLDIDFPKDMSDGSLKKYFDDINKSVIEEMIIPNNDLMLEYFNDYEG